MKYLRLNIVNPLVISNFCSIFAENKNYMGLTLDIINRDMLGESAYYSGDDFTKGLGTVCGYTYDDKYYIIGFYDDFGCVLSFNPKKVYIDEKYSKNCKSYRFSAVHKTIFY